MAKDNLETKVKKSVVNIDKNVQRIYNMLTDLSLKLTHVITGISDYRDYADYQY